MKSSFKAIWVGQMLLFLILANNALAVSKGVQLFVDKNYDQAKVVLEQELKQKGPSAEKNYYLGLTLIQLGDNESAVDLLEKTLQKFPDQKKIYLDLGIAHFNLKNLDKAGTYLHKAEKLFPRNATVHLFLGLLYNAQGKYQEAIKKFELAEAQNPEFSQLSKFNIGLAYYKKVDYEKAREFFNITLKLNANNQVAVAANKLLDTISGQKEDKIWGISTSGGWSYDDNVTLNSVNLNTGISDEILQTDLSAFYKVWKGETAELRVGYDFFQNLHEKLPQFDLQIHTGTLTASKVIGDFNFGFTYLYNHIFLDKFEFESIHTLSPSVGFQLAPWWYLNLEHSFSQKEFFNIPGRDGQNYMLNLSNYFVLDNGNGMIWAQYGFEGEDTRANLLDYLGQNAAVGTQLPIKFISEGTGVNISYRYFFRDFAVVTPVIGKERLDERHHMTFEISQEFLNHLNLKFSYQYIHSDSNLVFNDFEQNIISTSLRLTF